MAAQNTDNFIKTRRNFSTTIGTGGVADASVQTVPLASTTNLPTDTAICITINRVDANGAVTNNSETVIGVVSGTNVINSLRAVEGTAQAWASGVVVELLWCESNVNRIVTGITTEHNQDGTHNIPTTSLVGQYAVDTGAANAYAVTLSPAAGSYKTGMVVVFKAANANTTVSTINVNALGVKTIKKLDGATDVSANDIKAGQVVRVIYDGTNFQMTSPSAIALNTTDTQTLTNKRVTKRVFSEASNATPTPNADSYDVHEVTALAAGATFAAPTGTPTDGQPLVIRVKDNGTARALAFNSSYRFSSDLTAPTTTVISKTLYMGFVYNSADSKWDCLAILNNF